VPSTQDVAREAIDLLPVLVIAASQSAGRGRSGAEWLTADRALAVSMAFHHDEEEDRPLSLMAGVVAAEISAGASLKWPNDVMLGEEKVGGLLVERSGDTTVVGLGLNLWWPEPPNGFGALFDSDPGEHAYVEIGSLWGAELARTMAADGWPLERYRELCATIGRRITWEPGGDGQAIDVDRDGGLVVTTDDGPEILHSGAVSHVRS
jgi:BirA family biotin operon repressor/biotin-[acetyl-CoA-carboxylase] ligase